MDIISVIFNVLWAGEPHLVSIHIESSVWKILGTYLHFYFQKEEKIRLLKQRLAERDTGKAGLDGKPGDGGPASNILTVNRDTLIVADFITGEGTSDSAYGHTRSSRASASDFEFSESYL